MNPVAIAQQWNQGGVSAAELQGTPLSKDELAYVEGKTFRFRLTMKDGTRRVEEHNGERSIDAWLALFADLDARGWEPKNIEIEDLMGRFA